MNCKRCLTADAQYRVRTDISLEVCIYCAITAQEIGLEIEVLPRLQTENQQILMEFEKEPSRTER
jgi:hypothetical protein